MGRVAGTVVAVHEGLAWVDCEVGSAATCGGCDQRGQGCGWVRPRAGARLEVPAVLDGRTLAMGERLQIEADEGRLLRVALRLYLPPIAGLLLGPAVLRWCGLEVGLAPLAASAAGFLLGGLLARGWTRSGAPVVALRRT